jgi:hypothetical protein
MAFERFHPDPLIQARALRGAYLRWLLSRIKRRAELWLWARRPNTAKDGVEQVCTQSLPRPESTFGPRPLIRV